MNREERQHRIVVYYHEVAAKLRAGEIDAAQAHLMALPDEMIEEIVSENAETDA